jgi:hypothetical protein
MDIVIKSFNRPYYLDRCLYSIHKLVVDFNGKIIILDDGTPQSYLDKIIQKFPEVIVKKSAFYDQKVTNCAQGIQPDNYVIPIDLWANGVTEVSDYFLLIEDDTWFIDSVELEVIQNEMIQNQTVITKLFWLGNDKLKQNSGVQKTKHLDLLSPHLFTKNPILYNFIFRKDYLKWSRRILAKLGVYTFERHMAYYSIYAVAGTVLRKDFYSELWNNHSNKVEETLQILNALTFYKKNEGNITFASYQKELLKTGFQSAATNQHKEHYKGQIDMFQFNKIINEAWLNNELDVYQDLPNDIQTKAIAKILDKNATIDPQKWMSWVNSFKNQYTSIGCVID